MSAIAGRVISSIAVTGLVGTGLALSAAPASAADLGTQVIDCGDGNPSAIDVSGVVGDTFALHDDDDSSADCTSVGASPSGILAWSATPGGSDNPATLPGTGGAGGTGGTFYFTLLTPGTTTISYTLDDGGGSTLTFTVTVTAAGGSGGAPVMQLQQLPIPASGNCADADPNNALWAKQNTTEWTRQWGDWAEPIEFHGFVCGRWVWAEGTG